MPPEPSGGNPPESEENAQVSDGPSGGNPPEPPEEEEAQEAEPEAPVMLTLHTHTGEEIPWWHIVHWWHRRK